MHQKDNGKTALVVVVDKLTLAAKQEEEMQNKGIVYFGQDFDLRPLPF